MNHFYLHIMEREVKRGELRKVTKKKRISKKKKKDNKKGDKENQENDEVFDDLPMEQKLAQAFLKKYDDYELSEIWEAISSNLSEIIFNPTLAETVSIVDYLLQPNEEDSL